MLQLEKSKDGKPSTYYKKYLNCLHELFVKDYTSQSLNSDIVEFAEHIDYPVLDPVLAFKKFSNFCSWLAQAVYDSELSYLIEREGVIR